MRPRIFRSRRRRSAIGLCIAVHPEKWRRGVGQKVEPLGAEPARLALEQRQHRTADAGAPAIGQDHQRAEQAVRPFALDPAEPDQPSVVVEADEGAAGFGELCGCEVPA